MRSEFEYLMSLSNVGNYVGKWVAIVGNDLVATGSSGKEVFKLAKEKYPTREPFVMKVPADRVMLL